MRYVLTYGLLSGAVIIGVLIAGLTFGGHDSIFGEVWFGYLVMLVALSFIFVGVKRYRDVERGGVVGFLPALAVGLGIALTATAVYVLVWEAYLASTGYRFMDAFIAGELRKQRAAGASPAELSHLAAQFESMRIAYANPLMRIAFTAIEILPVGVGVALLSAVALMFPKVLPARNVAPARTRSVDEASDDVAIGA